MSIETYLLKFRFEEMRNNFIITSFYLHFSSFNVNLINKLHFCILIFVFILISKIKEMPIY